MSLHVYADMVQGSPEWLEARRGIVTASTVGQLITASTVKVASNAESRALTLALLTERITGEVEPTYQSPDMYRGMVCEPIARQMYSERYAPVTECGFMLLDIQRAGVKIGYSPDGLVGNDGLIEIKCPRRIEHVRTILADEVPSQYMAQLQCGLLVSQRQWIDYVSFCGGLPPYVKRVERDDRWRDAIWKAAENLEHAAVAMEGRYRAAVDGVPTTEPVDLYMDVVI